MQYYFKRSFVLQTPEVMYLLGRPEANLCFHFAGSGENLPDITKSRDTSMDNKKQNSFLFTSCNFSVEVFLQIARRLHVI